MVNVNENIEKLNKLHVQWISSIEACLGQLQIVDTATRRMQANAYTLQQQHELSNLRNKLLMQKDILCAIADEVNVFNRSVTAIYSNQDAISMQHLLENKRLRDKVLKAEQAVFVLRHNAALMDLKAG